MQSASSLHLAPGHVGVNLAESSISTSNGKVNDEPRVRARVGRFLRSIHSSATLKRGSKTLADYHIFRTNSVENKLINIRRPLGIEGKEKLLKTADSSWMEMAKPISTSFLHPEMELRTPPLSGASCAGINACLPDLKRPGRADTVLRWVVKQGVHVTLGPRRQNVLCHRAQFYCY